MFTLFLACATHGPPKLTADTAPMLPSPRGSTYGHVAVRPRDPLVAFVAQDLPVDEALSGAAAGVGLGMLSSEEMDVRAVRWKAILAGYPFPIVAMETETVPLDKPPVALLSKVTLGAHSDVGIVRVRGSETDTWIVLVGERRGELTPFPREVEPGETVPLGEGAQWTSADPDGVVRDVVLPFRPEQPGEWLLRAKIDGKTVATVPLYVGVDTPMNPPFSGELRADTTIAEALSQLARLRDRYGQIEATADPSLSSVARARLRTLLDGGTLPAAAEQLRAAGYLDMPVDGAECSARSVAACLDGLWWTPEHRAVLTGGYSGVGIASARGDGKLVIVLVAAG